MSPRSVDNLPQACDITRHRWYEQTVFEVTYKKKSLGVTWGQIHVLSIILATHCLTASELHCGYGSLQNNNTIRNTGNGKVAFLKTGTVCEFAYQN